MDILCLMGLFPQVYEKEIVENSISGVQNAANKLQWAIVKGLDQINDKPVTICNSLYIGAYPKRYRKMRIPTFQFSHTRGARDINIGFTNLPGVKILSRYSGIWRYVKKWAETDPEKEKCLIAYAMTLPFAIILKNVRKRYKNIKVCLVVPDLPEYMNVAAMQNDFRYRVMKKVEIAYLRHCLAEVGYYVFLTEEMKNWFRHEINYTVVEGICLDQAETSAERNQVFHDGKKHIIYTGGIKKEYGVLDLAAAFMKVKDNDWVLDLFGDGIHLNELREMAQLDQRIVCHGAVPNAVAVQAQREAALLVNPRPNYEFAKYSFPSKILEYMMSGNPMIAYKLAGVPDEYDSYYYHIDDGGKCLEEVMRETMGLEDDERRAMGERARDFVLKNKNPRVQCEKIVGMLTKKDA